MTIRTIDTEGIAALLGQRCRHELINQRAGEIVRRAIGSAELLQSRYKISAGECRISAPGGPVLRYLVDLSRLRMTYSALGGALNPSPAGSVILRM